MPPTPSTTGTAHDRMMAIVAEATADNLVAYTRTVAAEVRLSGSPEEARAFDEIAALLRGWDIPVETAHPTCLVSLPVAASLTLADGTDLPCITHSFAAPTAGVTGELVLAGDGSPEAYAGLDLAGRIAVVDGPAAPAKAVAAEGTGALAVIHVNPGEQIKEMIVSPVWGTPIPETLGLLPTLPHVSVNGATGAALREAIAAGPVAATVTAEVDTGWRPLPLLIGTIRPGAADDGSGDFVLLSGHVDSWHLGVIDNGTADASALETARVLAAHREELRREVRVAFWSGHSHARYATSAWFADEHWQEIHEHCVAHVNIDMPGFRGATDLTQAPTTAESHALAAEVIAAVGEQDLAYSRIGRMGDQSFWGAGIPSFYVSISAPGEGVSMEWYHTPLDTLDVIDPPLLERDARILLGTTWRLATDALLHFDQSAAVTEIRAALVDLAAAAGDALDLSAAIADADALLTATGRLRDAARTGTSADRAATINRVTMRVSRALMPVNYTAQGPFEQDLALQGPVLPGLTAVHTLAALPAGSPGRYVLETRLRRERNRVRHALRAARRVIDEALGA